MEVKCNHHKCFHFWINLQKWDKCLNLNSCSNKMLFNNRIPNNSKRLSSSNSNSSHSKYLAKTNNSNQYNLNKNHQKNLTFLTILIKCLANTILRKGKLQRDIHPLIQCKSLMHSRIYLNNQDTQGNRTSMLSSHHQVEKISDER